MADPAAVPSRLRVHREGSVVVVEDAESTIEIPLSSLANHIRALRSAAVGSDGATMEEMYSRGRTLWQIGRSHGVAPSTVAAHARREKWTRAKPVKGRACGCKRTGPHGWECVERRAEEERRRASA